MRCRFCWRRLRISAVNHRRCKTVLAFACFSILSGCAAEWEPVRLDLAGIGPSADVSDLSAVLAGAVTEDGRVVPSKLEPLKGRLNAQLQKMAVTGPTKTPSLYPTDAARWAYWYNARAAWSVQLAALAGFPERVAPEAMYRRAFPLDGRSMSLALVDEILLTEARRVGLFRLAACAPGVCVSEAPLPSRPHGAEDFAGHLVEAFDSLMLDERRVVLDIEAKQLRVPSMLWACRDLVLQTLERTYAGGSASRPSPSRESAAGADLITALRPHLGPAARRRLDQAVGYTVAPAKSDCRLAIPKRKIYFPGRVGRIEP